MLKILPTMYHAPLFLDNMVFKACWLSPVLGRHLALYTLEVMHHAIHILHKYCHGKKCTIRRCKIYIIADYFSAKVCAYSLNLKIVHKNRYLFLNIR